MSGVRRASGRQGTRQTVLRLSMRVWDLPTRLFHWAVVVLVATSYLSIQFDRFQLHLWSGYTLLALLLFRLAWGFVGSETSRFSQFLRSPAAAFAHLRQIGRREADAEVGHNAAGGWMVLALLAVLAVQVGTGLFGYDGEDRSGGPLAHLLPDRLAQQLIDIHAADIYVVFALTGLHVLAIIVYATVKGQNLLRPMITGRKRLPGATRPPRMAPITLALALVALSACIVWVLVTRL